MQGKEGEVFDKPFIDRSWTELRSQLDTHMPVQESETSSRGLVLLLLSLLTVSIGFTAFFAYKYKTLIPSTAMTKVNTVTKTLFQLRENPESSVSETIAYISIEDESVITNAEAVRPQESQLSTSKAQASEDNSVLSSKELLEQAQPLGLRKIDIHSANRSRKLNTTPHDIKEQEIERDIDFNVGLLKVASTDFDYTGYGVTSGISFPVGKKLGINTGLGFNIIAKDRYFLGSFPRSVETKAKENINGPVDITSMKQIYLPVSLNYEVTPWLAVNSGVKVRYTYSEQTENLIPLPTRAVGFGEIDSSPLERTNLGLSAGISYNFSKNMSVLLDSEWGFNSLLNSSLFNNDSGLNYDINLVNLTTSVRF